ncbi:MAG TPA: polysaccharide deacetylase family protein [Salinimicrobium sp.]|nr:polysaccharide deacetylase family protein [Salinimicrobium sp.]
MKNCCTSLALLLFLGLLMFPQMGCAQNPALKNTRETLGAITRMDSTKKEVYLIFSAHLFHEGGTSIYNSLRQNNVLASFFFTGDFYREKDNAKLIRNLLKEGHYLGAHSNKHLLYAPWENRDSTLITKNEFLNDLRGNYLEMAKFGISKEEAPFFLPPYEWYNREIAEWTEDFGLQLINPTPGTGTARDYTWPEMGERYTDSQTILNDLMETEAKKGLNGYIILIHLGTDPRRTDKFYRKLDELIRSLRNRGYTFERLPGLK